MALKVVSLTVLDIMMEVVDLFSLSVIFSQVFFQR